MPSRTVRQASHESIEESMNSCGSEGNPACSNTPRPTRGGGGIGGGGSGGSGGVEQPSPARSPLKGEAELWSLNYSGVCLASNGQFSDFLSGMGPAQFVGRQTLATTSLGAIPQIATRGHQGFCIGKSSLQLFLSPNFTRRSPGDVEVGLLERNGQLDVEIIQARGLTAKVGSRTPPAVYIKVYLLENGVCIAKKKTKVARKSLDPLYNQVLAFTESAQGKVLQVMVWGNYGRMERKHFMGVARILLEELDLSNVVIGWYKLFPTSSMVEPATGPLMRQSSQLSLESTVGPCCDKS